MGAFFRRHRPFNRERASFAAVLVVLAVGLFAHAGDRQKRLGREPGQKCKETNVLDDLLRV